MKFLPENRILIITLNGDEIDVVAFYRDKGQFLSPTLTMSGMEIRKAAGDDSNYQMYLDCGHETDKYVGMVEAWPLVHGMAFYTAPPATY